MCVCPHSTALQLFCITLQLLNAETISLLSESTQEPNSVSGARGPLAHACRMAGE